MSQNPTYRRPEPIGSILKRALGCGRLRGRWQVVEIHKYWKEVVGEATYKNAQPQCLTRGVLKVAVSSSAWMQQLQFMKETIKGGLNRRLGKKMITDIRLELKTSPLEEIKPKPAKVPWDGIKVDKGFKGLFKRGKEGIKDKDLRKLLRSIIRKQRQVDSFKGL
jgi:hypothetical protein